MAFDRNLNGSEAFRDAQVTLATRTEEFQVQVLHETEEYEILMAHPKEALKETDRKKLLPAIRRAHQNLGHPSNADLVRVMKAAKCSELALRLAREYKCDQCDSTRRPSPIDPSHLPKEWAPFESITLDVKELPGRVKGTRVKFLNIVDAFSKLQRMIRMALENGTEVCRAYRSGWRSPYGAPLVAKVDAGRVMYMGELANQFERDETRVRSAAGEAPEQIGDAERHGKWAEEILTRILLDVVPVDDAEYDLCVESMLDAKARMLRRGGFSPNQLAFGRDPPSVGSILREDPSIPLNSAILHGGPEARIQEIRAKSAVAVCQADNAEALRRSLEARPRVVKARETGDLVCYWRKGKGQGLKKQGRAGGGRAGWYGPAVVLGEDDGNYWISHRGQCIKAAPHQLRAATPTERRAALQLPGILQESAQEFEHGPRGYLDLSEETDDIPMEAQPRPVVAPDVWSSPVDDAWIDVSLLPDSVMSWLPRWRSDGFVPHSIRRHGPITSPLISHELPDGSLMGTMAARATILLDREGKVVRDLFHPMPVSVEMQLPVDVEHARGWTVFLRAAVPSGPSSSGSGGPARKRPPPPSGGGSGKSPKTTATALSVEELFVFVESIRDAGEGRAVPILHVPFPENETTCVDPNGDFIPAHQGPNYDVLLAAKKSKEVFMKGMDAPTKERFRIAKAS
jgi:hypothetical protein